MTYVIAFTGAAGCGKSTASKVLYQKGYNLVKFAGALKGMLASIGLTKDHLEGHLKNQPCSLLGGQTPRFAMQTLGTEWGRNIMADDFWINLWKMQAMRLPFVVVDDLRFPNEADAVRDLGGTIVRITRPLSLQNTDYAHASETDMASIIPDVTIENIGSLLRFEGEIETLMDPLMT